MKEALKNKESFVLYKGFWEPIKGLTDEQLGRLFRAIYSYQVDNTKECDADIQMAFMFFLNQFRVDEKKYLKTVERNRENGAKGGRPRKDEKEPSGLINNPNNPVGFLETQITHSNPLEPKKADKDKDKDKEKDNDKEKRKTKRFIPPSLNEVTVYATERKRPDLINPFFDYYQAGSWKDSTGKPVKNWKQRFISWENRSQIAPQHHNQPEETDFLKAHLNRINLKRINNGN